MARLVLASARYTNALESVAHISAHSSIFYLTSRGVATDFNKLLTLRKSRLPWGRKLFINIMGGIQLLPWEKVAFRGLIIVVVIYK